MNLVPIPWATQSAKSKSGVVTNERLVNCYLDVAPANSKSPTVIYGDAGLKLWTTLPESPIRGVLLFGGTHLFVVAGTGLYVVTEDKAATRIGDIPGGGPVSMCANATHVGIATNLGFFAATTTVVALVDANFYSSATYQDGYGILTLAESEQIYITGLDDMTTVDPLDFTSADTFADKVRGCISDHRELIVFGYETIEHYNNSGDSYFPFTRTPGGFAETGCAAAGSIAKHANLVFWLGNDGAVWTMGGYQPTKISTPGIERKIKGMGNKEAAQAFCYSLEGHDHYVLSFGSATLAYDITAGLWRERESFGLSRWRAQLHAYAWELDLVTDYESGNVYELDPDTDHENDAPLVRTIQPPPLHAGGKRVFLGYLCVDAEMGSKQPDPVLHVEEYATPGTYLWTPPIGVVDAKVECWGGGGGGGGGDGPTAPTHDGGGGGGGAFASATAPIDGATVPIVVAGGGGGGSGMWAPGADGGASSFGSLVVASGGLGGVTWLGISPGGDGGDPSSCVGDVIHGGGDGADSSTGLGGGGGGGGGTVAAGADAVGELHGVGGALEGGDGGDGGTAVTTGEPGSPGSTFGGGGGGASRKTAAPAGNFDGGDGADGMVRLTYYVQPLPPLFMLEWSDDGGNTWSAIRHGTAGLTGEYTKRSTWTRLGSFRTRTLRFSSSNIGRFAVLGAYADLRIGES